MQNLAIFLEIGIMIIIATVGGYLTYALRQPLIPAYILTGIIIGPVLGLIKTSAVIETMSLTGIAFLLFIVGLELSFKKLKDIGKIATIGGTIQVALTFLFGFVIAILFGLQKIEGIYIGIILAFSSTMVVIKLLADKKELSTLHGKIIIGILLMQDVFAIIALSMLATIDGNALIDIAIAFAKAAILLIIAFLSSKFIFPLLFKHAAKSQELLFLLSLSVCFIFSILFSMAGFSIAIGAFVAGVCLANLPYNIEIIAKVSSLRDFFATLFFVSLGVNLVIGNISKIAVLLAVLVVFIILIKPIILMFISSFFGYTKRTSFLTSISLAQVSEFSLILVAQGLALGHVSNEIYTLIVLLAIITIGTTSYFIKYELWLYNKLSKKLGFFDVMGKAMHLEYLPEKNEEQNYDAILIGYDRIGYNILHTFEKGRKRCMIIDFNPDIIKRLIKRKIPCMYGNIADDEIMERINFKKAELIVSTAPIYEDNLKLIRKIKSVNHKAVIFVRAESIDDALKLYKNEADYVILPHFLGGERVSGIIDETQGNLKIIAKTKLDHLHDLKKRYELEHEHPKKEY